MRSWGSAMLAALLGLVAGCVSLEEGTVERLRLAEAERGSPFTRALTQEYRELAIFEADERGDGARAERFAQKGLVAAEGGLVLPDQAPRTGEPAALGDTPGAGRERLMRVFAEGARHAQPGLAARAQARLDCWIAAFKDGAEAAREAGCRDQFHAALGRMEAVLGAEASQVNGVPDWGAKSGLDAFVVFFPNGGSRLDRAGRRVVEQSVITADKLGATGFTVYGYADRVGDRAANEALSRRRAEAVRTELLRLGVRPETVRAVAAGEAAPALPTADGVSEPANRRAEILIR